MAKHIKKFFSLVSYLPIFFIYTFLLITSCALKIRLIPLDFSKIGRLINLFWYLKFQRVLKKKTIEIFFLSDKIICNQEWYKLFTKIIHIRSYSHILKKVLQLDTFLKIERFNIDYSYFQNALLCFHNQKKIYKLDKKLIKRVIESNHKFINILKKDSTVGKKYLKSIGTTEYNYIVFNSRDNNYLNKTFPNKNWNYHNFRNSKIENYLLAAKNMARKNVLSIRTGLFVESKLKTLNNKIIDYSNSKYQSEYLDVYLGNKCLFAVYSQTGISWISEMSNRPIVYVNWPGVSFTSFNHNSLAIPKKFYDLKKNKYLNFKEILQLELNSNYRSDFFRKKNIQIIENTPREINDVVSEQYLRLKGNWRKNSEDEKLQEKFWKTYNFALFKSPSFRIGSDFLRKNKEYLD